MTEKRYFKKLYDYDWWYVFDREQEYCCKDNIKFSSVENLVPMDEKQVIDLLNENEQLKNENTRLTILNEKLETEDYTDLINELKKRTEENIQLKNEISGCKEVNKRLQDYNNRQRAKNERLHSDWDKIYRLCLEKGFTEDEIIKELER